MKKKKLLALMVLSLILPTGCGNAEDGQIQYPSAITITEEPSGTGQSEETQEDQSSGSQNADDPDSQSQASGSQNNEGQASGSQNTDNPGTQESRPESETEFGFGELSNSLFYFSSGAGAWFTELFIDSNGSFRGRYQDTDMGDIGDDYPNGTLYYCEFRGSFDGLEKVNSYTYKMTMSSLTFSQEPETQEIVDGVRYIYSTANGLDNGEEFYLYLPGAKLADLPGEYLSWINTLGPDGTEQTELPFYGLYNINAGTGFSSSTNENLKPFE